jgi:hypothetical protein
MQTPYEFLRLKISSLVTKKSESTFISKPMKLTRVKAYNENLDFNSQANHLFTLIKNL